jgi:hypothetical protein
MRHSFFILLFVPATAALADIHPAEVPLGQHPPLRSADYRNDQTFQVTAGLGSAIPYFGFGVNAAWFQKPDTLLTFSYLNGVSTEKIFSEFLFGSWEEIPEARWLSAGYKKFVVSSFYWEGTGFFRRLTQSSFHSRSYSYRSEEAEFRLDSLGGTFAIGNQWQWATFTLGCDWIGFGVPLAHGRLRMREYEIENAAEVDEEKREFERSAKESFPIVLRFYLGYSF